MACDAEGHGQIIGLHIGSSETEILSSSFLRSIVKRRVQGVKLVIYDAHEGLKAAITRVLGTNWQRCRVHWMRNALAHIPKTQKRVAV